MVLSLTACVMLPYHHLVRKLPRPIPRNSVESDIGCTTRIYFDNVTVMLHNVTIAKQTFINEASDLFQLNIDIVIFLLEIHKLNVFC